MKLLDAVAARVPGMARVSMVNKLDGGERVDAMFGACIVVVSFPACCWYSVIDRFGIAPEAWCSKVEGEKHSGWKR